MMRTYIHGVLLTVGCATAGSIVGFLWWTLTWHVTQMLEFYLTDSNVIKDPLSTSVSFLVGQGGWGPGFIVGGVAGALKVWRRW